eukprot:TRINITY_DN8745_c0_g1_i1.p1 TRINITY_DN8745_c0_g1~~TRINITY_DN8745_c0_g1_i1.p1  ORF type:complete len:257 (+),score=54.21 TRINITY_DN8745_c0_g1_i1:51-773(+)
MVRATTLPSTDAVTRLSGKKLKKEKQKGDIPTVKEMSLVKTAVYSSCDKKRKMLGWAKCPKFVLDPLVDRVMKMMNAKPGEKFVDAGCGIGNIIAHVATRFGCDCTGIEIAKHNLEVAKEAEGKFAAYRTEAGLAQPKVDYVEGDLRVELPPIIDDVDILWCSNFLFPIEVNAFLIGQIYRLKPGARVFLMRDLVPDRTNTGLNKYIEKTSFEWGAGDVEWTNEPGDLFMYVRTDVPYSR